MHKLEQIAEGIKRVIGMGGRQKNDSEWRTAAEIQEREVDDILRQLNNSAMTYYAPDGPEKSILGADGGMFVKLHLERFAKKYPDIHRLSVEYKYRGGDQQKDLKESTVYLYLEEEDFRVQGPWPDRSYKGAVIDEVWNRQHQTMTRGGRAEDNE